MPPTPSPDSLSLQQRVLASAMLRDAERLAVEYDESKPGVRAVSGSHLPDGAMAALAEKYRKDPKHCLAHVRQNLHAIAGDARLSPTDRRERLERYLDAAFSLMITLDHVAFPPDPEGVVRSGVPTYVPDGLSDMGRDPKLDRFRGDRERIRVDKPAIFRQCRAILLSILEKQCSKREAVERVARFVYERVRYDTNDDHNLGARANGATVLLADIIAAAEGVCRHQALVAQTLLQALGITCRLMKCRMDGVPHSCNLVRIDGSWYIFDSTNPFRNADRSFMQACLLPIPQRDVDTQAQNYRWEYPGPDERTGMKRPTLRTYESTNEMFSRIVPPGRAPGKRGI